MSDKKVWVVTFCPLGEHKGEFFREVAYLSAEAAMPDCIACMQQNGGRETFKERFGVQKAFPHVDRVWDSEQITVWLEMLTLVER